MTILQSMFNLLYPPRCPLCDLLSQSRNICGNCLESLHILGGDFTAPHLERVWFGRARSCFAYEGKILEAIHGFKYLKRFDLLSVFMHYLVSEIDKMGHYDVLIPVPLHWQRLWGRGYNPSALLARSLGKKLGIEVDCHVLKKNKNIAPQVGLRRDARLKNIKGAFDIHSRRKTRIEGKKVLLIDDVLTTGATINECAKVLVKKGACELVDILTIARTI